MLNWNNCICFCKMLIMKSVYILKKVFVMAILISAVIFLFFWANITFKSIDSSPLFVTQDLSPNVKNKICYVNYNDLRNYVNKTSDIKMIYYITPTYPRPEQIPELTRLAHTLMHVPRIHWIVADDQAICSEIVLELLKRTGLPFTLLSSPKPYTHKSSNHPRGVANRRAALSWLRDNVKNGVLYFGDDDNTVDLRLFDEIRQTKKVSMFPVGLIGNYGVSTPIVKDGKVVAFFDSWPADRTYPVDMAGFAINVKYLTPTATMPYIAGYEEDRFLVSLGLKIDDIEPLAENCSKVLVWHTKTAKFKKPALKINLDKLSHLPKYENFVGLLNETSRLGMAYINSTAGTRPYIIRNRKQFETLGGLL